MKHNRLIWCLAGQQLATALLGLLSLATPFQAEEAPRKPVAKTAPTYPDLARKMHLTGKVKLEVVVAASGTVTSAKFLGGSPVFEKSAVEAVKQWRFEPAAKETREQISLEFDDH